MARKSDPIVLVVDLEATCWEKPTDQPKNEFSEIIEMGVSIVDTSALTILETLSLMVKPENSRVSEFCTKLTTLTQSDVDKGMHFTDAMYVLRNKLKCNDRTFISWGDYDYNMIQRSCQYYKVSHLFRPNRHINLKNTFTVLHGLDSEPGLDSALKLLNIPLEGTHHRGSDDSFNISKVLIHTLRKFRGELSK